MFCYKQYVEKNYFAKKSGKMILLINKLWINKWITLWIIYQGL